jgi:hypothetical protein
VTEELSRRNLSEVVGKQPSLVEGLTTDAGPCGTSTPWFEVQNFSAKTMLPKSGEEVHEACTLRLCVEP